MQATIPGRPIRIESIDILRGIVMVIMALDHVRDYFHYDANLHNPLDIASTTPMLYFTRWVTHFCAPVFVFLSGISVYLQSLRKTKAELSSFLIKRGLWLIFVEVAIISFGWTFNPSYHVIPLQVIWAIGISMVILGIFVRLSFNVILATGLLIVLAHNLLDIVESAPGFKHHVLMDLLHSSRFSSYEFIEGHFFIIPYPFLPWTGLMMLGYCLGTIFTDKYTAIQRKKILVQAGLGLIVFFVVLRFINMYGDPYPWHAQPDLLHSFFSFMNVHKYPPSLLYSCITIGPALLALAYLENIRNRFTGMMRTYGRVAFFYYVLHIYLIHFFAMIVFFLRGHGFNEAYDPAARFPFYFIIPGEGFGLAGVYAVWIFVVISLYPLCRWYDNYKTTHKEKWWLSYL